MCGILGSFSSLLASSINFNAALRALHHRGPDDQGIESFSVANGQLIFGHTRLSIIDISIGGRQPKRSCDGRYAIVFNGEIYNYRELREELKSKGHNFETQSDTEVLLAAWSEWGNQCLKRLMGMFAFAIFDRMNETVTIVRDAFGIKPLFYKRDQQNFAFSSEISGLLPLLHIKPKINLQRSYRYLVCAKYDDDEDTFYEDVFHLRPGHLLCIELKNPVIGEPQRWWWPSITERTDLSFKDASEQLREMFLKNVRLHLRSDVPLGAALSGGIDSSSVVCAMRYVEPKMPIHTFSFIARGTKISEEKWVDMVNNYVDAIPHKIIVDPKELGSDLDDMIKSQGEPFGGTSIYAQYRVFRLARERGITVTLDGQGADEMLAGYNGYPLHYVRSLIEKQQYHKIAGFLYSWAQWPGRDHKKAIQIMAGMFVPTTVKKVFRKFTCRDHSLPSWINSRWFTECGVDMSSPELVFGENGHQGRRLAEVLRDALTNKGLVSLMRHGDRNSMRWSIESRVPFLTIEMAEYLLSLPEHYLLSSNGETKKIFREAMRGIVPDIILNRRDKIGFETPEREWLISQQKEIKQWLETLDALPFINANEARKKVENVLENNHVYTADVWRLINFSRWIQLQ